VKALFNPSHPSGRAVGAIVAALLELSLRRGLRGVYLRGAWLPPPFVLVMNHHSFFDGHLVWLLYRQMGASGSLLVAEENVRAFPMLKLQGALEAHRLREALRRLGRGEVVALFAEGAMRAPGPLGPLKPGARYLAHKAGVPLVPVAARVLVRGFEHPEAFMSLGEAVNPAEPLERALSKVLHDLDERLAQTHPRTIPAGFACILRGKRSLDEKLAPLAAALRKLRR
jgi:1-acyl-sn-glycerol-3-phosphate acyltransferase